MQGTKESFRLSQQKENKPQNTKKNITKKSWEISESQTKNKESDEKKNKTVRKLGVQCGRKLIQLKGIPERDKRENSREEIMVS